MKVNIYIQSGLLMFHPNKKKTHNEHSFSNLVFLLLEGSITFIFRQK